MFPNDREREEKVDTVELDYATRAFCISQGAHKPNSEIRRRTNRVHNELKLDN